MIMGAAQDEFWYLVGRDSLSSGMADSNIDLS